MAANDPAHVNVLTSMLSSKFKDPGVQQRVLAKLQEMNRELTHIQGAIRRFEHAIRTNTGFPGHATSTKQELRNWVVSLVESTAFLEYLLADYTTWYRFRILVGRAVDLGKQRGV